MSKEEYLEWAKGFEVKTRKSRYYAAMSELFESPLENYGLIQEKYSDVLKWDKEHNTLEPAFPLEFISGLINEDGIVKIGTEMVKFENHRVVKVKNGDLKKLEEASKLKSSQMENGIFISEVIKQTVPTAVASTSQLCYKQFNGGLPRYYYCQIEYSFFWDGNGTYGSEWYYSYHFRATGVAIVPTQRGLISDMHMSMTNISFDYYGPGPDIHKTIQGRDQSVTDYSLFRSLFSGICSTTIYKTPLDYPWELEFDYNFENNIDGSICQGTNVIVSH